jgi:hypothetical protein
MGSDFCTRSSSLASKKQKVVVTDGRWRALISIDLIRSFGIGVQPPCRLVRLDVWVQLLVIIIDPTSTQLKATKTGNREQGTETTSLSGRRTLS